MNCVVRHGTVPPGTTKKYEWSGDKSGDIKELEQDMTVGRGPSRFQVKAKYEAMKNQTTIRQSGQENVSVTLPGLVLLRMATRGGSIVVEYGSTVVSR